MSLAKRHMLEQIEADRCPVRGDGVRDGQHSWNDLGCTACGRERPIASAVSYAAALLAELPGKRCHRAPPGATEELDVYADDESSHEFRYGAYAKPDDAYTAFTVARDVAEQDILQYHTASGKRAYFTDGHPKLLMAVPLVAARDALYFHAGNRRSWLVYGKIKEELARAMAEANAEGVPKAAAIVIFRWIAGTYRICYENPSAKSLALLRKLLPPEFRSPIEKQFWDAHCRLALPQLAGLTPQYPVLRYRLDFALPEVKIGIELDGHETHSSTQAIAADRRRQREIETLGWRVIRFGGSEVFHDAETCVLQAAALAQKLGGHDAA